MQKGIKTFIINELVAAEQAISVLRTCPDISFAVANQVNYNFAAVKAAIAGHNEKVELLNERSLDLLPLSETDKISYEKKSLENRQDLNKLFLVLHQLEILVQDIDTFKDTEINGFKEVPQQNGQVLKFSYRDAYFILVGLGFIA